MLRIYKKNSDEIGDYTTSNNLMNFEDDISENELYDYTNSYLQWNTSIVPGNAGNFGTLAANTNPIKLYSLGDNTPDKYPASIGSMKFTPYKPSCLVMNGKLQSTNYNIGTQGLLESNRKLNFMQNNLNSFTEDQETKQSHDYYTGTPSLDLSQGHANATFPFTNVSKNGTVLSTYKSSNIIVPVKEVMPSFGNKVLPSWIGNLKHNYALENRKRVIGEVNPLSLTSTNHYKVDFLRFNNKTVAVGDVLQIVLTLPFSNLSQLQEYTSANLVAGATVGITYTLGGNVVGRRTTIAAGGIEFVGNVCTITLSAGGTGFAAGNVITDGKMHLNIIPIGTVAAGDVIVTTGQLFANAVDCPLYVGMGFRLIYASALGPPIVTQSFYTRVTELATAGPNVTITMDVAVVNVGQADTAFISYDGCYDGQSNDANTVAGTYPTFKIDKAELVSWHIQGIKEQPKAPIIFNKYDLIPINRPVTSQFQNTYIMPEGGIVKTVLLMNEINSDNNLIASDQNVYDYRLSFDNNPTTEKNVLMNSPMWLDRIYKSLGSDVNNLIIDPQSGIIMENNNTSNIKPVLDVQINAVDGTTLSANSILNVYVKSTSVLAP